MFPAKHEVLNILCAMYVYAISSELYTGPSHYYDICSPSPVFVWWRHSASVCRTGNCRDWCSNSAQILDDRGEELLAGTLIQVKADLIGHQQVILLHKLLQDVTHCLRVVQEYQALERWVKHMYESILYSDTDIIASKTLISMALIWTIK